MAVEHIAAAHAERQVTLARRTASELARLWRQIDRSNIAASWGGLLQQALVVLSTSQGTAAASAGLYVDDALEAQGIATDAAGRIAPLRFAGIASDGRPLAGLLLEPSITALSQIKQGASPAQALNSGRFLLDMISRTQVADAGRTAVGTAIAARPQVRGYVRMIVGKTCSRCLILAGRRYEWNAGFQRHPRCLPAGVVVSGPATLAATRRRFQGELVVISTAGGQQLPITGNHPVLTSRGWIPAHLVQEGDQVVRSTRGQGASALVVPDEDQVPTSIENLWRPDRMVTLDHVPTTAEDFHGDGCDGEVDVVLADRLLRYGFDTAVCEFAEQEQLPWGIAQAFALAQLSATQQQVRRLWYSAYRLVSRGGLCPPLIGSLASGADLSGCGHAPDLDARSFEAATHGGSRDSETTAQAVLAFTSAVRRSDALGRKLMVTPRWDAPSGPLSMESRLAYVDRGQDLFLRLTGQVELDRVVEVSRSDWSGHVYNLTSVEGWYSANGLIVSNCDCRHVPVAENVPDDVATDPKAYFDSLDEAGQDDLLGKAGADAVREGADMAKVVNARRGMQTADGRLYTTEAAGRRPRLMPEQIFRDARNREDAIRLLRLHGYLI